MKGTKNMEGNASKLLVLFVIFGGAAAVGACISAVLCWFDYWKLKKETEEEIVHLKEEVRACRSLLKRQSTRDG